MDAVGVDVDEIVVHRKEFGMRDRKDGHRVVNGRAFVAFFRVETVEEVEPFGDDVAHVSAVCADAVKFVGIEKRRFGDVESGHGDGESGVEDDLRGFGVNEDIKFRRARPIAETDAAAHEVDVLDSFPVFGIEEQEEGDIGERSRGDEGDLAFSLAENLVHEIDGSEVRDRCGFGECGSVEARFSVDASRSHDGAHEGFCRASCDGTRVVNEGRDASCVVGGLVDRLIAGDGRDAEDLKRGFGLGEGPGNRVVVSGIAVEDDLRHLNPPSSRARGSWSV